MVGGTSRDPGRSVRVTQVALILALLVLLAFEARSAWLFFSHGLRAVAFPYPLDYGEGPLLDQTLRLLRAENIYRSDLSSPPYNISNYPPLFVAIQTPLAALFGPSFLYGRIISLLSVLITAVCIGLTIHAITKDWVGALAGGLMLLALPYILHWAPLNRIDSLALGLSWLGLFVIARWPAARWSLITSALLIVAAIFTRQSYALAAPAAAFCWLLSQTPRRHAFVFAGIVAGTTLALFALLTLLTGGGFFFNVVTANVNPFYWDIVRRAYDELQSNAIYLLGSSLVFLIGAAILREKSWWLVGPYLVGGALTALTIGKSGSNVNYLFELSAALSLTAGALIAWPRHPLVRALLLLLLAWQVNDVYGWTREAYYPRIIGKIESSGEIAQLVDLIQRAPGPVLADEYMGLLPLDNRPILIQPFELKQLADAGIWNEQPFIDAIERHEFALITLYQTPDGYALYEDRWTERMLSAIFLNYHTVGVTAGCFILEPNQ